MDLDELILFKDVNELAIQRNHVLYLEVDGEACLLRPGVIDALDLFGGLRLASPRRSADAPADRTDHPPSAVQLKRLTTIRQRGVVQVAEVRGFTADGAFEIVDVLGGTKMVTTLTTVPTRPR